MATMISWVTIKAIEKRKGVNLERNEKQTLPAIHGSFKSKSLLVVVADYSAPRMAPVFAAEAVLGCDCRFRSLYANFCRAAAAV